MVFLKTKSQTTNLTLHLVYKFLSLLLITAVCFFVNTTENSIYFTSSCFRLLFSISYFTRQEEHTKFLLGSYTIIFCKYSFFTYHTYYLYTLSNTNCGRLCFPKMATITYSIPYALPIMWCGHSSLQVMEWVYVHPTL